MRRARCRWHTHLPFNCCKHAHLRQKKEFKSRLPSPFYESGQHFYSINYTLSADIMSSQSKSILMKWHIKCLNQRRWDRSPMYYKWGCVVQKEPKFLNKCHSAKEWINIDWAKWWFLPVCYCLFLIMCNMLHILFISIAENKLKLLQTPNNLVTIFIQNL